MTKKTVNNGVSIKEAKGQESVDIVSVPDLLTQLSSKNEDYVYKLRRELTKEGADAERETQLLEGLLPEMLKGQREGKPATQLFGPPIEKAHKLLTEKPQAKAQPLGIAGLDLSLLFMSIFSGIYALLAVVQPNGNKTGSGIPSLLVMSFGAGYVFSYYNNWVRLPRSERRSGIFMLLVSVAMMIALSFGATALSMINSPIFQPVAWPFYIGIGAITFGIHWYLKKTYNLRGLLAQ